MYQLLVVMRKRSGNTYKTKRKKIENLNKVTCSGKQTKR